MDPVSPSALPARTSSTLVPKLDRHSRQSQVNTMTSAPTEPQSSTPWSPWAFHRLSQSQSAFQVKSILTSTPTAESRLCAPMLRYRPTLMANQSISTSCSAFPSFRSLPDKLYTQCYPDFVEYLMLVAMKIIIIRNCYYV